MYPRSGFRSGGTCECTLVPVFVPGEHANVPSFRFSFRGNIRTYPRSGFRSAGTSAKTTLLETTLLGSSDLRQLSLLKVLRLRGEKVWFENAQFYKQKGRIGPGQVFQLHDLKGNKNQKSDALCAQKLLSLERESFLSARKLQAGLSHKGPRRSSWYKVKQGSWLLSTPLWDPAVQSRSPGRRLSFLGVQSAQGSSKLKAAFFKLLFFKLRFTKLS